ncbi:uncharacterized protein LOC125665659 isoform X3 [Ostrea edulis]|uniref:uncharacterized protein LOC125665659 isoform X3 n=1 Tax=Ostrea edulis TaxID=37623 RepID=UPI0024AFD45B|nr:uncharacterized protein LOC125665659 isoform X3 [Ostrea edulis]
MGTWKMLCLLGIVFIAVPLSDGQAQYRSALVAANTVSENINKGAFTRVIQDVSKSISPFINMFTSVVKLIFGISATPTESPELQFLRHLSDTINRRFDQVNTDFLDVTRLIRWSAVQVAYSSLEAKIHVVSEHFTRLFQVPKSGFTDQKNLFINSYETDYSDSGSKLFAGFMFDNGAFSQGMVKPAMLYTENDRKKMRIFMLGILKLILVAAKVELGYMAIKGQDDIIPFYAHLWNVRMEQIQNKMQVVDLKLENIYYNQSLKDIDKFVIENSNLDSKNYSQSLYDKLSKKYFWRDWLVVVSTSPGHSRVCEGITKSAHGKYFVIDSVKKDRPSLNSNAIHPLYASLNKTCQNTAHYIPCQTVDLCSYPYYSCISHTCYDYLTGSRPCRRFRRCGSYENSNSADNIFGWFNKNLISCSTFSSVGVIPTAGTFYASPGNVSNRLFVGDLGYCEYNVHFFG